MGRIVTFAGAGLSVVVGFREDDTPTDGQGVPRRVLWDWLRKRYAALLPDAEICVGDVPGPFNRAAARNAAAAQATRDLLLIADADTAWNLPQIAAAVGTVRAGGAQWCLPFTVYRQMGIQDTILTVKGSPSDDVRADSHRWASSESTAGLVVLSREAWETVRGYDSRYGPHWSYDDTSFGLALSTLCHPEVRTPGSALHLHHPRTPDRRAGLAVNAPLFARYEAANGDVQAMTALIGER